MNERTPRHPRRRLIAAVALATGVLTGVAACSPGPSADSSAGGTKTSGPVSNDPAKAGKVTLTEWDQNTDPGTDASTEALNKAFMKKYPNVTIKRVSRSFSDLKTTLKLALSSTNPPDVVQANQGYPDMGAFVKARLLQPVDRYAKVYGWNTAYPSSSCSTSTSFTSDGKTWKTGNLYGVSQTGEIVGVYYNKAKLKSLGLPRPTTLAELREGAGQVQGIRPAAAVLRRLRQEPRHPPLRSRTGRRPPARRRSAISSSTRAAPSGPDSGTVKAAEHAAAAGPTRGT